MRHPRLAAGLIAGFACLSLAARAEAPRTACRPDAERLCPQAVAARDRTAVRACLVRNVGQLSPPCRDALVQAHVVAAPAG